MSTSSLRQRCKVNTDYESDTFVGIKCENGDIQINFPLGFNVSVEDKEFRKDVLLLINCLSKNTERKDSTLNMKDNEHLVELPIHAYMYVVKDYYTRGYYREKETTYQISKSGKINWTRTIKTQKTYLQDDEIFYLTYVTKKNAVNDNEIITLIHEYCVYESFSKIGWLFTTFIPKKPTIKFNRRVFENTLKSKISQTFNDRNKQLFRNMLAIVKSIGDDGIATDYKYGTHRFEYVWEKMIDKTYGISNKADYFPKTHWNLSDKEYDNASLEPDTIMLVNGDKTKVYVIDAKYYKFGATGIPGHLPESTSINKQITYGEYIAEIDKFKDVNGNSPTVYNAFIMPYDMYGEKFHTKQELHYVGIAYSDWKKSDGKKSYENVQGILLDVKSLMRAHTNDNDKIMKLAELIEGKACNYA